MSVRRRIIIAVLALAVIGIAFWSLRPTNPTAWTDAEIAVLQSLWIGNLGPLPADPTNAVADDPRAARLGHMLFFDARLSTNGAIACATCHQPERRFTDGLPKAVAIGMSQRNTPSIVGAAYSPWLYWDGRKDSLWSQALSPLEDPNEHGSDRAQIVAVIASDPVYRDAYESLFGELPDIGDAVAVNRAFANVGKAIAAYERLLLPGSSRFDAYVEVVVAGDTAAQVELFNDVEIGGLRLFVGEANCTQCHNGPMLTNHEFHNTGVIAFPGEVPDKGRVVGVRQVLQDVFSCSGPFSDDRSGNCPELEFARTGSELIGSVRTPSLRNLDGTAPFMHKGQMPSLMDSLRHYNEAPLAMIGHNEAKPLKLSKRQLRQLEAFLLTLAAPLATDEEWLRAPGKP